MPLAFDSSNRGRIAFGFFQIESDMLLLEHLFFFADGFCRAVGELAAASPDAPFETDWPGWSIDRPGDVGDLMAAIHGVRHTGFIGATYLRWPFPEREEDFRQNPEGDRTRDEVREMIAEYGVETRIRLLAEAGETSIGEVRFDAPAFRELVRYVDRGGWPRWRGDVRPGYVEEMTAAAKESRRPLI